jgi:hypothetical protein
MEGRGYDLIIFAPARLVSPGTSGQGGDCIDMTAPFCGQTRTRGAGRPQQLLTELRSHCAQPDRLAGHVTSFAKMMTRRTGSKDLASHATGIIYRHNTMIAPS